MDFIGGILTMSNYQCAMCNEWQRGVFENDD